MSEFQTTDLQGLSEATGVSNDAVVGVQEPNGPVQKLKIERLFAHILTNDSARNTEENLQLVVAEGADEIGLVFADPDAAKSGWYRSTAAGAGNWLQFEKLSGQALAEVQAAITAAYETLNAAIGTAQAARDVSQQWASLPEDTEIPGHPGEYSAKHWDAKAAARLVALDATVSAAIDAAVASAVGAAALSAETALSAANSASEDATQTLTYKNQAGDFAGSAAEDAGDAQTARDDVIAIAGTAGAFKAYDTYADADADIDSIAEDEVVQILADEVANGERTFRRKSGVGLVLRNTLLAAASFMSMGFATAQGIAPIPDAEVLEIITAGKIYAYAHGFGKAGKTPDENRIAMQSAINKAMDNYSDAQDAGRWEVILPHKRVQMRGVVIGAKRIAGNTNYEATSFGIRGMGGYGGSKAPEIVQVGMDGGVGFALPMFILQHTRNTSIEGVKLKGPIGIAPSLKTIVNDDVVPWYLNGAGPSTFRTNQYSPSCAIAIDPFSNDASGEAAGDHYPGYSDWYNVNKGSNTVKIENCNFYGFYIGVASSLSKNGQQGDGFVARNNRFYSCKINYAIGQTQTRASSIYDNFMNYCGTMVDTVNYGDRAGIFPEIYGGQSVIFKQLFIGQTAGSQAGSIIGHYIEEGWRIGYWDGASPVTIIGLHGKLAIPANHNMSAPDAILHAQGSGMQFIGGEVWRHDNEMEALGIYLNGARITFRGTAIDAPFIVSSNNGVDGVVKYEDCSILNESGSCYGISGKLMGMTGMPAAARVSHSQVGDRWVEIGHTDTTEYREWIGHGTPRVSMDSTRTVTVDSDNGTASFTSDNPWRYQVGETVCSSSAWTMEPFHDNGLTYNTAGHMPIGRVSLIDGTTIHLVNVPKGLTTGDRPISLVRTGRIYDRMLAVTTNGSPVVTIVGNATQLVAGHRIRGNGIPLGAYIIGRTGSDVTLSAPCTASNTVQVYDARLELSADSRRSISAGPPNTGVWWKGDYFGAFNDTTTTSRVIGFECVESGSPSTWVKRYSQPEILMSASTAYTVGIPDLGIKRRMSSGSAVTVTLPPALPIGESGEIVRGGAGSVTFAPGAGVTIESPGGILTIGAQYGSVKYTVVAANTYLLEGGLG